MDKLKKIAKGLDVFFNVTYWCAMIWLAFGGCLALSILVRGTLLQPPEAVGRVLLDYCGISFTGSVMPALNYTPAFVVLATLGVAATVIYLYGIKEIRKMLSPMKQGRPFDTAVSKSLAQLGWLALIYGAAEIIFMAFSQRMVLRALTAAASGTGAIIGRENIYSVTFIIVAALLFLFSYIFRYGETLQRQADETL